MNNHRASRRRTASQYRGWWVRNYRWGFHKSKSSQDEDIRRSFQTSNWSHISRHIPICKKYLNFVSIVNDYNLKTKYILNYSVHQLFFLFIGYGTLYEIKYSLNLWVRVIYIANYCSDNHNWDHENSYIPELVIRLNWYYCVFFFHRHVMQVYRASDG